MENGITLLSFIEKPCLFLVWWKYDLLTQPDSERRPEFTGYNHLGIMSKAMFSMESSWFLRIINNLLI